MKAFASWSGGKDAMLALHRFNKENDCEIAALVNMCDESGLRSKSHGIEAGLIKQQANSVGIDILQLPTNTKNYRTNLVNTIFKLKEQGINAGVFGDIFLQEHRDWIEAVCKETGIDSVFPLWGNDTKELLNEFVQDGFKSMVVAINNSKLDQSWLGRIIDKDFQNDIMQLKGVDPCAEYGEYHTFVFDGPIFNKAIKLNKGKIYSDEKSSFIQIS